MPFRNKRNSRDDNSKGRVRKSGPQLRRTSTNERSGESNTRGANTRDRFPNEREKSPGSRYERRERGATERSGNRYDRENAERPGHRYERRERGATERSGNRYDRGNAERPGHRYERRDFKPPFRSRKTKENPENDGLVRLNRYVANAGVCSRRKADELIVAGVISVNGEVVTELGTKVDPAKDEVRYNGERLKREKMVYVLLNKPKDYITTTDDPQERRTVMDLVAKASRERIYPVGRLDRNTTGLLLLTNDGNLAERLAHPRHNITKLYHVELDKNLTQGDFNKIEFGLELEDGFVKPDDLSYVAGASKREVGIKIHSGKNRIVRRIFEHLGYNVVKLDRVIYATLTKKDLPRGRWRYLEEREIANLKSIVK